MDILIKIFIDLAFPEVKKTIIFVKIFPWNSNFSKREIYVKLEFMEIITLNLEQIICKKFDATPIGRSY